ncbi:glycoside hydrolase family 16 protein [Xylariaceae sp. FL1019]|nr:glycoside hydrolase family 16 protein [Xylariaceae sp. FL1019]
MSLYKNLLRAGGMLSLALSAQAQSYTIQDTYDTTNFFEGFEFYSEPDPTAGFVEYVDAATANTTSLAGYANGGIYLGVDYTTANPVNGRQSVRVNTVKSYTHGLFIVDLAHMPAQACGAWPAFWSFGPNWPSSGEIDIIEGVNSASNSSITLHTASGCSFSQDSYASGDCGAPGDGTEGCGHPTENTQTFGNDFNTAGGGVYAMQWTSSAISIFFFPKSGSVPSDIAAGTPDPSTWGTPLASFSGGSCNIDDNFANHQLVFDTTFCGQWAGKVWDQDATCSALATTCQDYVGANPSAFQDVYWLINSVKVYGENTSATRFARRFNA